MGLSKRILANHGEIYIKTVLRSMYRVCMYMKCEWIANMYVRHVQSFDKFTVNLHGQ